MAEKLRTLDFGDGKGARVLVPDWENVENKPFGEGIVTTLADVVLTQFNDDGTAVIWPTVKLEEGKEYTVIYNGVEYTSTAIAFNDIPGFGSGVAIGNGVAFGFPNTGEPFIIGYIGGEYPVSSLIPLDGSTNITLTVIGEGLKTIDEKFIPPVYVKTFHIDITETPIYLYKNIYREEKVTKDELKKCILDDAVIIKLLYGGGAALSILEADVTSTHGCVIFQKVTFEGLDTLWAYTAEYTR